MRKRRIGFNATGNAGAELAEILRSYAYTAYPPGGSECAAASRESLLGYASDAESGAFEIGSRQFPMIKAAIKWYCVETEKDDKFRDLLLNCFEKL